jgi:UDP:flavonoid glycosyltransferase YjiC (YdhE family)
VILFPAIKQHGVPWVRIVSCSENEIEDPLIPPHLSGCGADDLQAHARFREHFNVTIGPLHAQFNLSWLSTAKLPLGRPLSIPTESAALPETDSGAHPLCRTLSIPGRLCKNSPTWCRHFANNESPSCTCSPVALAPAMHRCSAPDLALGQFPCRALVNVGSYLDQYHSVPANVFIDSWFPQPSVIPQVDVVIHHGGNNSFTECLFFGKPALIMPFAWDGHDNATRVQETGYGFLVAPTGLRRPYDCLRRCLDGGAMRARL